ncbi:Fc receptor-like protein 5 [Talpa occidentalis]|uniref:Fc receptor-like protein 5 n=1 Tax=Talpa occidentalis TaxID=50954 RepID=UPI00188FC141|nr:Fc receptor-like protein 5 [Talpa occidentalis]
MDLDHRQVVQEVSDYIEANAPVISLHPPWTTAFKRELVTLTCNGFRSPRETTWYFEGHILGNTSRNSRKVNESGEYRCQTQDSPPSKPVHLVFSTASLILQAPLAVFEGDSVVLRCRGKAEFTLRSVQLYKNDKLLADLGSTSDFHIEQASLKDNGVYKCTAIKEDCWSVSSNAARIQVQELFPKPKLTASNSRPTAGSPVKLTCNTQLAPQRSYVQLQFRFLSESLALTTWNSSPEVQITLLKEDSAFYFCQAQRVTSHFLKDSPKLYIYVRVPVSHPVLTISTPRTPALEGDMVTLHCEAQRGSPPIQYHFFHNGVFLQRSQAPWGTAHLRFPLTAKHSGSYYCTANNGGTTQSSRAMSLSVTVPVSPPVLTLSTPRTPALEGDLVTLHCEAQRGSPPIFYQFNHEDVILKSSSTLFGGGVSFNFSLSTEHSGNYHCTGDNGFGPQHSEVVSLSIFVPVSHPVLTVRTPGAQAVVGDVVELHCEAQRGSPPILYQFYQEDKTLGSISAPSGRGVSFNLSLTTEHSGNYACVASNGQGAQRSETVLLSVTVPVSQPVLTLRVPRTQVVVGDMVELHCEVQEGSPPILYWFYHGEVALGSSSAPSGGGTSFTFSLTTEHSGNYSCQASNGFRAQQSEAVTLSITVPVSRPVLTLSAPTQAAVGDVVELHCEAQRGSPPILYRFYHENVTLGNSSAPSGGGVSFNLSLTTEHSGNYFCEADNGLGAQRSDMVALLMTGLTGSRSGAVVTGVTGGLLSMMGLAVVALLLYHWIPRKAGRRPASDPARSSADSAPQDSTYYNVPGWIEMQPVYSNVNPKRGEVIYSEVRTKEKNKPAATSAPGLLKNTGSSVIYTQVKVASTPASWPQLLASSAPHR